MGYGHGHGARLSEIQSLHRHRLNPSKGSAPGLIIHTSNLRYMEYHTTVKNTTTYVSLNISLYFGIGQIKSDDELEPVIGCVKKLFRTAPHTHKDALAQCLVGWLSSSSLPPHPPHNSNAWRYRNKRAIAAIRCRRDFRTSKYIQQGRDLSIR